MLKDTILITIGQISKIGGVVYDATTSFQPEVCVGILTKNAEIPKKRFCEDTKRYNTILRMINVIFSEGFVQGFLKWNDIRNRVDHETGVGGKMQKWFGAVHLAMYGGNNVRPYNDVVDSDDNNDDNTNDDQYGTIDTSWP
jgi:hypothetical protein